MAKHNEINPEGKRIIIFIGVEGSGKTTFAKKLSQESKVPYIGTGEIIRDTAKNDSGPLGDACREMSKQHAYLSPALIGEILSNRLSKPDISNGAVIDGALRTLEETELFDKTLEEAGKEGFEIVVIYLDVPTDVGIERRLNSANKRPDDTREGLQRRTKHFYDGLEERIIIAKQRYRFFQIDALSNEEEVYSKVISVLNK